MSVVQDFRDIERIKEIVEVLFDEGFGFLLVKLQIDHHLTLTKRIKARLASEKKISIEERLTKAMIKLGPTFVKFGQALSLRPDIVPESYVKEFEKMQDHVDPFPFVEVEQILLAEYQKPIHEMFKNFDKNPVASASLSQVHRAILKNGKHVAVKVQRPNMRAVIETDIDIMKKLAELIGKRLDADNSRKIIKIIGEFEKWINAELDFSMEANNAEAFRHNFEKDKNIYIPKIYHEYTTSKILVMEYIDGVELNQLEKLSGKKDLLLSLDKIYDAILRQAFIYGLFHADPHPGNMIIMKDKKICFIDFGIVGRLDDALKRQLGDIFLAITNNDSESAINAFMRMTETKPSNDCRRELSGLLSSINLSDVKDINITYLFNKSFAIVNKYEIAVPIDLVLFTKMVSMIEGLGIRYNPHFNFMEYSKPFSKKIIESRISPKEIAKRVKKTAVTYKNLIEDFPEDATAIIDRLKSGKMKIDIEDADIRNFSVEIEHSSGNIAIGMLVAALIVGAGLVYSSAKPVAIGAFIGAALLAVWLIRRTVFYRN